MRTTKFATASPSPLTSPPPSMTSVSVCRPSCLQAPPRSWRSSSPSSASPSSPSSASPSSSPSTALASARYHQSSQCCSRRHTLRRVAPAKPCGPFSYREQISATAASAGSGSASSSGGSSGGRGFSNKAAHTSQQKQPQPQQQQPQHKPVQQPAPHGGYDNTASSNSSSGGTARDELVRTVTDALRSCSVFVLGGSSSANWAVSQQLAKALGYTPVSTGAIVQQLTSQSLDNIAASEGLDAVNNAEAAVLQSLATNVRLVVSTLGSPWRVQPRWQQQQQQQQQHSKDEERWRYLFGGIVILLQFEDEEASWLEGFHTDVDAAIRVATRSAEWDSEQQQQQHQGKEVEDTDRGQVTQAVSEGVLKAMNVVLQNDPHLPGKKSLYIRMGCRGDWPELMPPGWSPNNSQPPSGCVSGTDPPSPQAPQLEDNA